jgi:hypothetical protein
MIARLVLAICFPLLAAGAGLDLFTVANSVETPVPAVLGLGSAPAGDLLETRFRIRNGTGAAITLERLAALGSGFSVYGAPSLPFIVAPSANVDFLVRFTAASYGSFSANLVVNGAAYVLTASAPPSLVVTVDGVPVASGTAIDFGKIERGSSAARVLTLQNPASLALGVSSLQVSGAGFAVTGAVAPFQVAPGASVRFEIACTPAKSGIVNGSLTIDNRAFSLTAFAVEPKAPRPVLSLSSVVLTSGQQVQAQIALSEKSRANVTGQLTLANKSGARDDALLFTSSGKPSLTFDIHEGDTEVHFGSSLQATFQTGATAGDLVVTAELGGYTDQATIGIAPANVHVDSAAALRGNSTLVVEISGFDNTRTVSNIGFTFYDRNGEPFGGMPIRVDVSADFKRWFDQSTLGGMFALKATFPVTGDPAQVSAVQVEWQNTVGSNTTEKLRF